MLKIKRNVEKEFLTFAELAKYSGMSKSTLRKWKSAGMPYFKLGRSIRIKRDEFDVWVEKFRASGLTDKVRAVGAWDEALKEVVNGN